MVIVNILLVAHTPALNTLTEISLSTFLRAFLSASFAFVVITCLGLVRLVELLQRLPQSTFCHVDEIFAWFPNRSQRIHKHVFQPSSSHIVTHVLREFVKNIPREKMCRVKLGVL